MGFDSVFTTQATDSLPLLHVPRRHRKCSRWGSSECGRSSTQPSQWQTVRVCVHSVNQRTEEHRADQRQTAGGLAAGAQSAVLRRVAGANDVGLADDGHRLGLHNPGNGLLALVARASGDIASVAVGAAVSVVRAARGLGERAAAIRACAHNIRQQMKAEPTKDKPVAVWQQVFSAGHCDALPGQTTLALGRMGIDLVFTTQATDSLPGRVESDNRSLASGRRRRASGLRRVKHQPGENTMNGLLAALIEFGPEPFVSTVV